MHMLNMYRCRICIYMGACVFCHPFRPNGWARMPGAMFVSPLENLWKRVMGHHVGHAILVPLHHVLAGTAWILMGLPAPAEYPQKWPKQPVFWIEATSMGTFWVQVPVGSYQTHLFGRNIEASDGSTCTLGIQIPESRSYIYIHIF